MRNHLIINAITAQKWKGGITNDKKYFSEKMQEKVLTTVKKMHNKGLSVVGLWLWGINCWLLVRLYYTTHNRQPTTHNQHANTEREEKDGL